MSNRLFQGVIHQMRDAIDRTIGVIDETSVIIACSELGRIGEVNDSITADVLAAPGTFVVNGYTYKSFGSRPRPEYAVFVSGSDPEASRYASLLAISLSSIKQYYDEKYDRSNFIKNVILDNILPGDIYLKARELRFNTDVSRVCMLIKITINLMFPLMMSFKIYSLIKQKTLSSILMKLILPWSKKYAAILK